MIILVNGATATTTRLGPHALGALMQPRSGNRPPTDRPWALDNDAFQGFEPAPFVAMLQRYHGVSGCLWCAAPDVVGDARATLELFRHWRKVVVWFGYPVALVAQDGLEHERVPWHRLDALFIGGSTAWKLGAPAAALAQEAKRRGKWLHIGRVNTRSRLEYAGSLDADSVDGTQASMFADTHLPWMRAYCDVQQHRMEGT